MLISTNKQKKPWVIPKSRWYDGDDIKDIVKTTTWEEAGVLGTVRRRVGKFIERKNTTVQAYHLMYEIESNEVFDIYPQSKGRVRRWFNYQEAVMIVKDKHIRDALRMSSVSPPILAFQTSKKLEIQKEEAVKKKRDNKRKKMREKLGYSVSEEISVPGSSGIKINEDASTSKSGLKNSTDSEENYIGTSSRNECSLNDVHTVPLDGLPSTSKTQNTTGISESGFSAEAQPISAQSSISKKSQQSEKSNTFTEGQLSQSTGKTSQEDTTSINRRRSWAKFIPMYNSKNKKRAQPEDLATKMEDLNLANQ